MLNLDHIRFAGAETREKTGVEPPPVRAGIAFAPAATSTPPWPHVAHDPLLGWILRSAGLKPHYYRARTLERRLAACQRQLGVMSRDAARALLEEQPKLLASTLNAVLIGVSDFFRDRTVFAALEREILPALLQTRRGLRVYGAGVSSGQELYSIAMLLEAAGVLPNCDLTGIDCRPDAIAWARAGIYTDEAIAGVPAPWRRRYFKPMWGGWQVAPELAQRIRWEVANVFHYVEPACWDLILFRNVAIYLEPAYAVRAWELLCDQLAPGGYLVSGKAEKPPAPLPLKRVAPCLYQKMES